MEEQVVSGGDVQPDTHEVVDTFDDIKNNDAKDNESTSNLQQNEDEKEGTVDTAATVEAASLNTTTTKAETGSDNSENHEENLCANCHFMQRKMLEMQEEIKALRLQLRQALMAQEDADRFVFSS